LSGLDKNKDAALIGAVNQLINIVNKQINEDKKKINQLRQ
jgi:hypothetical protein